MPDITSRKSETDDDRRRNEQQFAALAKGLANVDNMGEREREIFDKIAASRPASKGPRHRAASDLFDHSFVAIYAGEPLPPAFDAMRKLGERMAREREEKVIDAPFRVLEDAPTKAAREPGMPPMIADADLRALFSNGRGRMKLIDEAPPRILPDQSRGNDPTA